MPEAPACALQDGRKKKGFLLGRSFLPISRVRDGGIKVNEETYQLQNTEDRIDVPSLVRSEPFRGEGNLSGHAQLELVIRNFKESQQFSDEYPDIGFVDQCI